MFRSLYLIVFAFLFAHCSPAPEPEATSGLRDSAPLSAPAQNTYSYVVFDITDSLGQPHGAGYDIYQGTKRFIHQTTVPGEPGTEGFVSREEAARVAELVVTKLESASGFPSVTRRELDSLHITLQSH